MFVRAQFPDRVELRLLVHLYGDHHPVRHAFRSHVAVAVSKM
jgi:hypothetical protein